MSNPVQQGVCVVVWLGLCAAPAGSPKNGAAGNTSDKSAAIAALIVRLDDPSFVERERAATALAALGEDALPALNRAAAENDNSLELRRRAESLVAAIIATLLRGRESGMKLRFIAAGEFTMGSPANEARRQGDEAAHRVKISRPFLLGAYEVTQAEYAKVMKNNPSHFRPDGEGKAKVNGLDADRLPVEKVTWFDALEYCNQLSKVDGLPPYYSLTEVRRAGGAIAEAKVTVAGGNGYRLPTEAEWEYACRAGTSSRFHYGQHTTSKDANLKLLVGYGMYGEAPRWHTPDRTEKVGKYKANAWGLHDMHGNVAEWCWDNYSPDAYAKEPPADPLGPAAGKQRVVRGGSWLVADDSGRSASRFWQAPGEAAYFIGFRVARTPK